MPSNLINSIHKKTGIPKVQLEEKWSKAKKVAKKQYKITENSKRFWPIVVGIFKKSLGKDVESKIAAHVEAFIYIKAGTDIEEVTSLPELDYGRIKDSIINKVHSISGIPATILENKWEIVKQAVISTYCLKEGDIQFLPKVVMGFQSSLASINPSYGTAFSSVFDNAVYGENKIKPPNTKSLPIGINPEAVHLWKDVIKKKKKAINKYKDPLYKWGAAIVFFKDACARKGLVPFTNSTKPKKEEKEPIDTFLAAFAEPCIKFFEKVEKHLATKGFTVKNVAKKFKMEKVQKSDKNMLLIASKQLKLRKTETAAGVCIELIPKFGLRKYQARGTFRRKQSSNSAVVIKYSKKSDTMLQAIIEIKINSRLWKALQEHKKDPKKYLNTWVNKGFKASAAEESTEDHDYIIQTHYSANSRDEAINLLNKTPVSVIVNLGDPEFQLKLAKNVKDIMSKFDVEVPKSLNDFIESEEYRNNAREEFSNNLPDYPENYEGEAVGPKLFQD